MVQNNYQIRQNVSVADVATVLGTSSSDVGTLCKHSNVNKWAIYKPEKSNKVFLTKADRIANHCGLTPVTSSTLKSHTYPIASASSTRTMDISQLKEWTYTKPTGGASSPYRLGDFLDIGSDGNPTSEGYNHDAIACDNGWNNISVDISNINAVTGGTFTTSGSSTAFILTSSNSWVLCQTASIRFGEDSASQLGSANSKYMPLTYASGANIASEYWRMGILVWIPYYHSGSAANFWMLFAGKKPLRAISSSNTIGDMLPNLASNQFGSYLLRYNKLTKGVSSFTCIPVLVKNILTTVVTVNNVNMQTLQLNSSDSTSLVYSMPSGFQTFTMSVTNSSSNAIEASDIAKFSGVNLNYKIGTKNGVTWYVAFRATGTANYQTVYNIYILTDSKSAVSANITGTLTYVSNPTGASGGGTNRTYTLSNQTVNANTAVPVGAGGTNVYGYSITGGVGLGYVSCTFKFA